MKICTQCKKEKPIEDFYKHKAYKGGGKSVIQLLIKCLGNQRGCFGGSPSSAPIPTPAPQQADPSVKLAEDEARRRQRAAASNTMLTGPMGVTAAKTMQPKSLLGA